MPRPSSDADLSPKPNRALISASFEGPIPPPAMLAHYNEVIPEGADRIFAMAEKNGEHRRSLETFVVHAEHKRSMWGLVCGLLIVLSLLLCGTVVTLDGHPEVGIAIVGMDILGVTGSLIYGTESRRRERLRRAEIMTGRR